MQATSQADHRAALRQRFLARLLALRPGSVLDVGCGHGEVLTALVEAGITAHGVERDAAVAAALRQRGIPVAAADAAALPFADGSFDLVCMRHVLHHLPHPGQALQQMLRVCRSGLLVAEPWYDASLPCQRAALAADLWLNVQLLRRGRLHRDMLGAGDMLTLLPQVVPGAAEIEHHLPWHARDLEHLRAELAEVVDDLPPDAPERQQAEGLLARARRDGLSWNGSVLLAVRKDAAPAGAPTAAPSAPAPRPG